MLVVLHVAVKTAPSVPPDALSKAAQKNVAIMVGVIVSQASACVQMTSFTMGQLATCHTDVMKKKQIGLCQWTSGAGPHASTDTFWLALRPIWQDQRTLFTISTRQCVPSHAREMPGKTLELKHMLAITRIGGRSLIPLAASTAGAITLWLDCSARTAIRCIVWKWQNAAR
jgi:hypothetical protein